MTVAWCVQRSKELMSLQRCETGGSPSSCFCLWKQYCALSSAGLHRSRVSAQKRAEIGGRFKESYTPLLSMSAQVEKRIPEELVVQVTKLLAKPVFVF